MGLNWIDLAQDRDNCRALVSAVMNLWAPQNVGTFLTGLATFNCSRRTVLHGEIKEVIK
jgi:hypothetical protein